MKNFLRVAALAICAIFMTANASAQGTYDQATMGAKVVEMETASWGQNSPFNNYCWSEYGGSTHAKAGCVPVAFAIVMRYHGFPAEGTSTTLNNCQKPDLPYEEITDRTYDWEKMPLTNGSGWTTEQQHEVAKLISHLGHAFGVSYGVSQTSVSIGDSQTERLTKYFNYKAASATSQYPSNNNLESWKQKIKESLNNGCPVPYAANNTGTGDSRHMFVIDGYTSNDYFHFNFGWNGSGNGWFKLDNITPAQGDNYSWSDDSDGYTSKHQAFFNLMPNKTPRTVTATTNSSSMGTVSINGGTAGNSVSAEVTEGTKATLTAHPADGYALASWTKNGVIVGTKNPIQVTVSESGNDYVANFDDAANVQIEKTCTFKISDVTTSGINEAYCSTWTTSDGIVLNCTKGSEPAYALSTSVNTFFAKAPVGNSETLVSDITYTLTAPEGFVIKSYSFKGKSPSSSYTIDVTVGGNTTNVTNASAGVVISASDINSKSTSFVLGSTYTGRAGLSIMEDGVTVTIQSEGGASTPTPEPEPTPTTYTVSTTANPAAGGTAKFAVGTGSQKTQGDVNSGETVTLYAVANTGYNFVNWTLGGNVVSTDATCNVNVAQASNYVANFEANTPAEPTTSLAGKFFRLKVKNTSNYMNIANTNNNTSSTSGVTVVAKNESSDTQIFLFEQSGNGYKLKANSGNYIKCHAWNANANTTSANDATELTFETTGNELEYLIKWDNTNMNQGVERDDYFKAENGYVFCDAAIGSATTWVLEEVIPSLTVTFAGATWVNEASSWWEYIVTNQTPAVTVKAANSAKAIGYSTVSSVRHPYLLDGNSFTISLPANCKIVGYTLRYKGHNLNTKTFTYTGNNGTTATETVGQDGVEKTLTVTGLENNEIAISVSDQSSQAGVVIVALEITYIEDTDLETYTVAVTAGENGTATASAETVAEGDNVTLTATANSGYKFAGWYDGETKVSEANPYTFAVTSNINYEARFEELFPDGTYKIYWQQNNRGYLAYHETNSPSKAVLADVTYTGCANLHYNSSSDPVNLNWYLITDDDGKRYLFQATTGKFLGYESGTTNNKLNLTEALPIAIEENIKHSGYYIITSTINNNSRVLLCSACGTETKNNGNGVRWLDVTDSNQQDGGAPLKFVPVSDVTVAESVMNTVLRVINGNNAVPFKVEIEGLRENDPNTHFATITVGGTAVKLAPAHLTQSEIEATLVAGSTLAINHKYRGFEFNGFYIGTTSLGESATLTDEQIAAISATTPLVAKFTATNTGEATLFSAEDEFSYRIPAIAKTGTNRLVAISDYRHNLDDIGRDNHSTGKKRIDLVMRTSDDNGATWSDIKTIAAGDDSKVGSYLRAFGDAAVATVGNNIIVMCAAGDVLYTSGTTDNPNRMARIFSSDNGANWTIEEMTTKMYSQSTSLIPNGGSAFFGSGKLAVDENFNGTGNARIYGALLVRIKNNDGNYSNYNNFVVYSDDLGENWSILGGSQDKIASGDEPKVEILPNGQILLSARRQGGRIFRVFTYSNKATNVGSWGDAAVNGCDNGGQNATNGEIICLDAKRPNGKRTKILLQSQPKGGSGQYERYNVTIWYKEVSADETYTPSSIASGWTQGLEVCPAGVKSAYSAMCLQANGEIAFFFEEAPCYGDDHTKGYSMVYVPLTIEEITEDNFLNPNADIEYIPIEFNIELTDTEGNIYRETLDYIPTDVDATLTAKYPFITLGANGNLEQTGDKAYTYTNTVTLPFKVSNAEKTYWHNIYWPANTRENDYPVYLSASSKDDTYVPKVTGSYAYGNHPTYNTLDGNEKISWAIYNVNNGFEFIFKNKVTDKYIQVTNVADAGAQNVVYVENIENATAFTIFNKPAGNDYYTPAQYALAAKVGETTGYLCSTSATGYNYATHYFNSSNNGYGHQGAWIEFVEAPDYQGIYDKLIADINNFGDGEGKYKDDNTISGINKDALRTMLFSDLTAQATAVQTVKESYSEITLTVPVVNDVAPGSVKILNEAVSHKFVPKGEITIEAVPAAGYRFVNWTRPAVVASAAARTAEARNSNVVSDQNPYTVTVSEALSLVANFEQIVVNATLTDAQGNTYNVQLSGFTAEITKEAVADKLREAYPYITLGTTDQEGNVIDFGVLNIDGTAYTYTNRVELPFKVTNTTYMWHNIYYPSNNTSHSGYPNYLAALNDDEIVDMAASPDYAYGANPNYNTKDGDNKISWAIYNVNNSFEFIFKSKSTGKYIKVESVVNATGNTQNVKFVENAEDATAFTLLKDTGTYNGDFALVANVNDATGYLCATSSNTNYVTHFDRNNHQGAWVKFVETPDYYSKIMDIGIILGLKFGAGDGKCIITPSIQEVIDAMQSSGSITLNTLTEYGLRLEDAMNNWPAVGLTINPVDGGTTNINGEAGVVHKYVPNDYELPLAAVPAEGYHFVSWTDGASEIETTEYTKTINGGKGDVIELTANFAKNIYNIKVTASEGGNAMIGTGTSTTVEHGNEVTLTAIANTGYEFAGWYDGDVLVSNEATYAFTATSDINYTARFNETVVNPTKFAIHITVASTDGTAVTNAPDGNVKAVIELDGQDWVTDYDCIVNASVKLTATKDHNLKAYLFDGWYKNNVLVSNKPEITVQATETATYEARFFRGCVVIGKSNNNRFGYVSSITLADGTSIGYNASNRAVVEAGTSVSLNTRIEMGGYELGSWTDAEGNIVGTDKDLVVEVNEDVTYTANFEPASYNLTVRANIDSYGTVSATSGTLTGTTIKVGHNMDATITATANDGYYFVNWTKGTEVVSTENSYTIEGIADIENLVDVEYIANFVEVENAPAGTYYRIAYDFPVAAANASAARVGATRTVGDTYTYTLTPQNIGLSSSNNNTSSFDYTGTNPVALRMTATTSDGTSVNTIARQSNTMFKLYAYANGSSSINFNLSAPDGYKITGYNFTYKEYTANTITVICNDNKQITESTTSSGYYVLTVTPDKQTAEFTLQASANQQYYLYVKEFTVTIQEVGDEGSGSEGEGGGETPETPTEPTYEKYYMQSVASGVANKTNALLMTQETGAASIFYYADSKLLSYDKGTYIKEDGNTRGLQAVGTSGTVTITTTGETSTIAAPSYMHAVDGTTRYVDHCSSNTGTAAHANHNFVLEEVTMLPVTISSALHATFYAPVAVKIPEGIRAYVLKEKNITTDTWVTMTMLQNGIIPANTGVILRSDEAKIYDFIITENTDEARAEAVGNILEGTVAKSYVNKDAYILTIKNNVVGMYPLSNNSYITGGATATFTNNSHKAYLPVEGNFAQLLQQGTGFRFVFDDETTEIEEVETEVENTIYDLQGRKLSEIIEPGIYIVGGKKVWVK